MKILLTGACGFVGSSLARAFQESLEGAEITGIDNLSRPGSELNRRELQSRGIPILHRDIRSASDFEDLPTVDWVIDAAANPSVLAGVDGQSSSRQLMEHNLAGTINLLEYCKQHQAGFLLLSTSRVYSIQPLAELPVEVEQDAFVPDFSKGETPGISGQGVDESFSTEPPVSLYGASKVASEQLALEYGATFDFPVWINRCGVLAGAGQFGHAQQGIFSFWLHAWLREKPLKYIGFGGTGHQVRDALHPNDLVPVLRRQMASPDQTAERVMNLSGGRSNSLSLAQVSAWCRERWGEREVGTVKEERPFDIPWMVLDASRAKEIWSFEVSRPIENVLEEIALFAEANPHWLTLSGHST